MAENDGRINTPCPWCGREEDGKWYCTCPSDDCPSHSKKPIRFKGNGVNFYKLFQLVFNDASKRGLHSPIGEAEAVMKRYHVYAEQSKPKNGEHSEISICLMFMLDSELPQAEALEDRRKAYEKLKAEFEPKEGGLGV